MIMDPSVAEWIAKVSLVLFVVIGAVLAFGLGVLGKPDNTQLKSRLRAFRKGHKVVWAEYAQRFFNPTARPAATLEAEHGSGPFSIDEVSVPRWKGGESSPYPIVFIHTRKGRVAFSSFYLRHVA